MKKFSFWYLTFTNKSTLLFTRNYFQVGGQAVLGRQDASPTPWLTERHGYDPTLKPLC